MSDITIRPDDIGTPDVSIKVNVAGGMDGATFTPDVSEEGVLSWSNDAGLQNPEPVNIKGKDGAGVIDVTVTGGEETEDGGCGCDIDGAIMDALVKLEIAPVVLDDDGAILADDEDNMLINV